MEKFCKTCGSIFDDLNFKICPYCGSKLDTRYGRQPIPRRLRHEVFKRDGYRCRECGASKDEISLEIDHILPVAKGGTNDIDNLQTLCRECNRMKHTDEWVGGETDFDVAKNELINLQEQLQNANERLNNATTDYEKLDYEFKVMKLKDDIDEVNNLINISNKKENEILRIQEMEKAKQIAYKKLYVNLNKKSINVLASYFNLHDKKSEVLKHAVNYVVEEEIFNQLYDNFDRELLEKNRKLFSKDYYLIDLDDNFDSAEDYYEYIKEYVSEEEFYYQLNQQEEFNEIYKARNAMENILHDIALSWSVEKGILFPIFFLEEGLANISIVGRVDTISDILEYDKSSSDILEDEYQIQEINILLKDNHDMINVMFDDISMLDGINNGDLIQINGVEVNHCYFKNFKKIYGSRKINQQYGFCKSFNQYELYEEIEVHADFNSSITKLIVSHFPDSETIIEKINSIVSSKIKHDEEKVKEEQRKRIEIQKEIEKKNQQKQRKEKFLSDLPLILNINSKSFLSSYYNTSDNSELMKILVENFVTENEIYEFIENEIEKQKYESTRKLLMKSPVYINSLLDEIFDLIGVGLNSETDRISYLRDNYSIKELKHLINNSENIVINRKLEKLKNQKRN